MCQIKLEERIIFCIRAAPVEFPHIGVGVGAHLILWKGGTAYDLQRHIGTVVGDTLQIDQQLQELGPLFDRAGTGLQPLHVAVLQRRGQEIHHLLQGFHLDGQGAAAALIAGCGLIQRLAYRSGELFQLLTSPGGEGDPSVMENGSALREINRVVADALVIGQGVKQLRDMAALLRCQGPAGEFDQIAVQQALQLVQRGLGLIEPLQLFGVKLPQQLHRQLVVVPGELTHLHHSIVGPLQRQGRGGQKPLVQYGELPLLRAARHRKLDQFDQLPMKRQQQGGTGHIEGQMQIGDGAHVHGGLPEGEAEEGVARIEDDQEKDRADQIKGEVDHGGPLGVLGGTYGGEQGGDAGADILPHDQRHGHVEGDHAGGADGLQNAHGGGRTLKQGGDRCTHGNPQEGVGEGGKYRLELRHGLERGHGGGHGVHTDKQQAQPQRDLADAALVPAFEELVEEDPQYRQNGPQKGGVEEHEQHVVRLDIPQPQQLSGDGGADVGPHDDAHGLFQLHDAGVDKAHAHNSGCGGALDQSGDHGAQQDTLPDAVGQPLQNMLQPAAGEFLQAVCHGGHAEQEGGNGAHQGNNVGKLHKVPSNLAFQPFFTNRNIFHTEIIISSPKRFVNKAGSFFQSLEVPLNAGAKSVHFVHVYRENDIGTEPEGIKWSRRWEQCSLRGFYWC